MYFSVSGVASSASNLISVSYTSLACNGVSSTTVYQAPHAGGFDVALTVYADANLLTLYTGFFTVPATNYTVYVTGGTVDAPPYIYSFTGTNCLGAPLTVYSYTSSITEGSTVWTDKCADTSAYDGYLVYPTSGTVYSVAMGVMGAPTTCPSLYTGYSVTTCSAAPLTIYQTIDTGFDPSFTVYADEIGTTFTGGFTVGFYSTPYYCVAGIAVNTSDIGCLYGFNDAIDCCSGEAITYYTINDSPLQTNTGRLYKYTASPSPAIIPYTGAFRLSYNNLSRVAANGYQSFSNSYFCLTGYATAGTTFYSSALNDYTTLYTIIGIVASASDYAAVQSTRWFTYTTTETNNPACATLLIAPDGYYSYDPIYGPHYEMFNGYAHQL